MFFPGVEARLAALTLDTADLQRLSSLSARSDLPSTFQPAQLAQVATALPALFNTLFIRRAIIPAANGHCSARALARYYACLADLGNIPKRPSSSSPPLGSHTHIPMFSSQEDPPKRETGTIKKCLNMLSLCKTMMAENFRHKESSKDASGPSYSRVPTEASTTSSVDVDLCAKCNEANGVGHRCKIQKIFRNPRIHDAFMGLGEYENLALPNGDFGLGFKRITSSDGSIVGFGHSGMGGSTAFCDISNRFSIAITLNKLSSGAVTGEIIHLVCSELNIPLPKELKGLGERGTEMELNPGQPLIN